MIFRSRPRRVICVVCFLPPHSKDYPPPRNHPTHPQVSKTIPALQEGAPSRKHRYRKRYPAHEGDSCVNASLPSHSWVSKTIPDTQEQRKRLSHSIIGIENDTRHPSSGNVGSLINLWYISLNSLNSLILQKKLQKTLVSRLSSLVFLLSLWRI